MDNEKYDIYVFTISGDIISLLNSMDKLNNGLKQIVQIIKCNSLISIRQLIISTYHTLKAFKRKRNIARRPYLELLLRLSGQKQIKDALNTLGVPTEAHEACLIVILHENAPNTIQDIITHFKSMNTSISTDIISCFILKEIPERLKNIIIIRKDRPSVIELEKERIMKSALIDLL